MTKVWLLALTASLLAGIGQVNAQDETPQPTPEETSAVVNPAAEEVSENKADYDALIEAQGRAVEVELQRDVKDIEGQAEFKR